MCDRTILDDNCFTMYVKDRMSNEELLGDALLDEIPAVEPQKATLVSAEQQKKGE